MNKLVLTLWVLALTSFSLSAQKQQVSKASDIFELQHFIENKGQFDNNVPNKVEATHAYINNGEEIYLTDVGFIVRLSKLNLKAKYENVDAHELHELKEKGIVAHNLQEQWIELNWLGAQIGGTSNRWGETKHYYTYGHKKFNSKGFKSIKRNNIYNKIDVQYNAPEQGGIEYVLSLRPGAELSDIKFQYKGASKVSLNKAQDEVIIDNEIERLYEKNIYAYYEGDKKSPIVIRYKLNKGVLSFETDEPIDKNRTLIIDPWVTTVTSLTGSTGTFGGDNIAYDVDFDSDGNLFVLGGGGYISATSNSYSKIAKYDNSGSLLWTFMGQIIAPAWNSSPNTFGADVGNFVVDKVSGKTYYAQGFGTNGAEVIRLDVAGNYDNFITIPNPNFQEIWDMKINNSTGEVLALGGGTTASNTVGIIDTTTGTVAVSNATASALMLQDVVCGLIDKQGDLFLLFVQPWNNPANLVQDHIYKINSTYNGFNWRTRTGFNTVSEAKNKPKVNAVVSTSPASFQTFSNGYNALAFNEQYIFYYDGLSLQAYDKATGAAVGVPYVLSAQTPLFQGGINSNACNTVYVGGDNGNVLSFQFDGTSFTRGVDLTIAGQTGNAVNDIQYNDANNLLYICGDGFVATIDRPISGDTTSSNFSIEAAVSCITKGEVVVTINNPDLSKSYTFVYTDTLLGTEVSRVVKSPGDILDIITGLVPGRGYKLTVSEGVCAAPKVIYFTIPVDGIILKQGIEICPDSVATLPDGSTVSEEGIFSTNYLDIYGCDSLVIETNVVINESLCPTPNCLFMPNAFSPNGDNNNDLIGPILECPVGFDKYEYSIFNRWGQMIFITNDSRQSWNGTFSGEPQPIGSYFYLIKYSIKNRSAENSVRGDITLIR